MVWSENLSIGGFFKLGHIPASSYCARRKKYVDTEWCSIMTRILFNHILHDQEKINSVTLFFGCQLFYSTGVTYVNSIWALQIFYDSYYWPDLLSWSPYIQILSITYAIPTDDINLKPTLKSWF